MICIVVSFPYNLLRSVVYSTKHVEKCHTILEDSHQQEYNHKNSIYFPPQYLSLIPHGHRGLFLLQVSTKKRRQILMPVSLLLGVLGGDSHNHAKKVFQCVTASLLKLSQILSESLQFSCIPAEK